MNDKKKTNDKSKPEHVVRCRTVTATIALRQSNAGYGYYDFCLGRCWTSVASGKEVHGNSFFEQHQEDLILAITEAAAWIRAKLHGSLLQTEANAPDQAHCTSSPLPEE